MRILVESDFWSRNNFLSRRILVHLQPGDILSLFTTCVIPAARPRLLITSQTTLPSAASCKVRQVTTASSHFSRRITSWSTGGADELIKHIYSTAFHLASSISNLKIPWFSCQLQLSFLAFLSLVFLTLLSMTRVCGI